MEPFWDQPDFHSLFPSLAHERQVEKEKEQARLLLRLLDQMQEEEGAQEPMQRPLKEYLKIGPQGDIQREDEERKKGVVTLDQLPPDPEFQMYRPDKPADPLLRLQTGRRLSDGSTKRAFAFGGLRLDIGSVPLELALLIIGLLVLLVWQLTRSRRSDRRIEREVNRRVAAALAQREAKPILCLKHIV